MYINEMDGARIIDSSALRAIPISKNIYHLIGSTPTLITNPSDSRGRYRSLILKVESGSFRFRPGDYIVKTVESIDVSDDTMTISGNGYHLGDGPVKFSSTGNLPGGLISGEAYFISPVTDDKFKVYTSGGEKVDLTSVGSGTITTVGMPSSTGTVTDGYGSIKVDVDDGYLAISAPDRLTIVGSSGTDFLTYWWVR